MTEVTEIFGATSTADDVLSGVNLRGKRILVTGVSAGLGVETARSLAAHGARVVGAARDLKVCRRRPGTSYREALVVKFMNEGIELGLLLKELSEVRRYINRPSHGRN